MRPKEHFGCGPVHAESGYTRPRPVHSAAFARETAARIAPIMTSRQSSPEGV